jgi:SAM-dependent methyltransferase
VNRNDHSARVGKGEDSLPAPSPWITRFCSLIRPEGRVLDVACGSGRHLRGLHSRGFAVTGVDRDAQAVAPLAGIAEIIVADIENAPWPLPGRRFDAVIVTNYLWRPLWPSLLESLVDGGVLLYETFSERQAEIGRPKRAEFLLRHGELIALAAGLHIVAYEDGFLSNPDRFVQRIAAVKPPSAQAQPVRYPL